MTPAVFHVLIIWPPIACLGRSFPKVRWPQSYEARRAAKAKLTFDGEKYKNLSLAAAISRYAPPNENNIAAYQQSVLAAVGGGNKKMSIYTVAEREAIMDAMQRVEGYRQAGP